MRQWKIYLRPKQLQSVKTYRVKVGIVVEAVHTLFSSNSSGIALVVILSIAAEGSFAWRIWCL